MKVHGRRNRNIVPSPQAKLSYSNCVAASTAHFLRLLLDGIMVWSHEPTAGLNNETCDSGFQIFLYFHCLSLYFYFLSFAIQRLAYSFTSMPCPCFLHSSFLIYSFHFYLMLLFSNEAARLLQSI